VDRIAVVDGGGRVRRAQIDTQEIGHDRPERSAGTLPAATGEATRARRAP
jgi:hypothetical protein